MPQDLQDLAWSAPMRDLAAKVGISDVGLKKALKARGIVTPPQGHWNRVLAGKRAPPCPRVSSRGPGESGRLWVDARIAKLVSPAEPLPSTGPFATPAVPEDLEELYRRELQALGRVAVPRTLERPHAGLMALLAKEQRRREKAAASKWNWDEPRFDGRLDQRRLRLLNALFLALSRRGHWGEAHDRDGELIIHVTIGHTIVPVALEVFGSPGAGRGSPPRGGRLPARPGLRLSLGTTADGDTDQSWKDGADGKLEAQLGPIAAAIITAGEAGFRRGLKEAEEREEQCRRWGAAKSKRSATASG